VYWYTLNYIVNNRPLANWSTGYIRKTVVTNNLIFQRSSCGHFLQLFFRFVNDVGTSKLSTTLQQASAFCHAAHIKKHGEKGELGLKRQGLCRPVNLVNALSTVSSVRRQLVRKQLTPHTVALKARTFRIISFVCFFTLIRSSTHFFKFFFSPRRLTEIFMLRRPIQNLHPILFTSVLATSVATYSLHHIFSYFKLNTVLELRYKA
jgi:hypothetical protein